MLAIASATFGAPSQTFVRDHARYLSPDATVLICRDDRGAAALGYPVFRSKSRNEARLPLAVRIARALERRWLRYFDPVRAQLDENLFGCSTRHETTRLASFLARHRPAAVLAEFGPVGMQVADACGLTKVPLFVHFHGWDANVLGASPSIRRSYRALFARAAGAVVTTEFLKGRLFALGCPAEKLHVCPCGVDTDLFRPGGAIEDRRLLMVSRLVPQKGPEHSLASFARLSERVPDAILEIVGDGPLRGQLERQAAWQGVSDRVIFHGERKHDFVRDTMSRAAVFLQHAVSLPGEGIESQGLTLLEAMACGVPVVATRHGAIVEVVEDGVSGLLVEERDVAAMANAIVRLLQDDEARSAMATAARQRVIARYRQSEVIGRLRSILGLDGKANRSAAA